MLYRVQRRKEEEAIIRGGGEGEGRRELKDG